MNTTIAWISARALIGRRRVLLLLPLPLLLILLAALVHGGVDSTDDLHKLTQFVLVGFGLGMVVPLTALLLGTGVFGLEIDDGTLMHILAKPVPRWEIVISKFVVVAGLSVAVTAPALFIAGLIADGAALGTGFAVGGAVASVAYCAFFLALSLMNRRSVVIGLLYIMVWELTMGKLVSGVRSLSIGQYATTLAHSVSDSSTFSADVSLLTAIVMSAAIVVGAIGLAIHRLRSFSVASGV
jgi:ABC-2 type transport system permease protein